MHEASLVQGLIGIVLEELARHNAENPQKPAKLRKISCELGLLSCVEEETLKACFEIFAEGTPAENASLELARTPLACKCGTCGADFTMEKQEFFCPRCGGAELRFTGGQGLTLVGLAVDCEDEND